MFVQSKIQPVVALVLAISLTACGGGGGGGNPPPPPNETENHAPTASISGPATALELATITLDAGAADADGDDLTYSWRQVEGPAAKIVGDAGKETLTVVMPKVEIAASLKFEVEVGDGEDSVVSSHGIDVNEGSGLLFVARKDADGFKEVYRYHETDTAPVRLSSGFAPGEGKPASTGVTGVAVSPDRRHVAYIRLFDDGSSRLMVAGTDGRAETAIGALQAHEGLANVTAFGWAPNDSRIVFRGDFGSEDDRFQLYAVKIDKDGAVGESHPLTGDLVIDGQFGDFGWSPDGTRVAFIANSNDSAPDQLFVAVVAEDGGAGLEDPVLVSTTASGSENDVFDFKWSGDATRIAYRANIINPSTQSLYVTAVSADAATINISGFPAATTAEADDRIASYEWSNDGLFIAARGNFYTTAPEHEIVVRKIRLDGTTDGSLIPIHGSTANGGDTAAFAWSPTNRSIAFRGDMSIVGKHDLYIVNIDDSGAPGNRVKVTSGMGTVGMPVFGFDWSPDGRLLVFKRNPDGDSNNNLYAVSNDALAGPTAAVNLTFDKLDDITGFNWTWTPDGRHIAFVDDYDVDDEQGVSVIGMDDLGNRTGRTSIAGDIVEEGDVSIFDGPAFSNDGKYVVYVGDLENNDKHSIFRMKLDENLQPVERTNLSGDMDVLVGGGLGAQAEYYWIGPPAN